MNTDMREIKIKLFHKQFPDDDTDAMIAQDKSGGLIRTFPASRTKYPCAVPSSGACNRACLRFSIGTNSANRQVDIKWRFFNE